MIPKGIVFSQSALLQTTRTGFISLSNINTNFMKTISLLLLLSLCFGLSSNAQDAKSAQDILKEASQQAKKEKKKVFVMYHASWCYWCHKMDDAMNDPSRKKFFDDNFVIVHLVTGEMQDKTHLNTPGAEETLAAHKGTGAGLPYWTFLDVDGKTLTDSRQGETASTNIGCPATEEEVTTFMNKLKTVTKVPKKAYKAIFERFRANEAKH